MWKRLAALLLAVLTLSSVPASAADSDETETTEKEFRAVWVATILNLDYPSKQGLSAEELKAEAIEILDRCVGIGFNAVFLQVRPEGDALYKSDYFPWSAWLTGTQGKSPGFDPLAFWVTEAHKRGLELHAWVNPFRVARNLNDLTKLAANNPARENPSWVVMHSDGHMYLDPGIPEARALVTAGVAEIVKNYDVDGIHFDDYFYPDSGFEDEKTFKKYGTGYSDIGDWRRNNIDRFIKATYDAVKAINPDCDFGVSPFAVWANRSKNSLGSDTSSLQTYYDHYADTRKWVKEGMLDYICPQIYWYIGQEGSDYKKVLDWWADVVRGTGVKLYVGHADYKCGSSEANSPWRGTEEIRRQLELNAAVLEVDGSVHFRYQFFVSNPALSDCVKSVYNAVPAEYPKLRVSSVKGTLAVGRPWKNISTTFGAYYLLGSSDPSKNLYINGKAVKERTAAGYFGVLLDLNAGVNVITLTQEGSMIVRTITRIFPSTATETKKLEKAEIVKDSAYPNAYGEYGMPGEKVTLRCEAPIGAVVRVTLAGQSYLMLPDDTEKPGSGLYATTYRYDYELPEYGQTDEICTIGTPVYTMTYNGTTKRATAKRGVFCLTVGAPFFAAVTADNLSLYDLNSTEGGPSAELDLGMTDRITAVTDNGEWVRLGMGGWVKRSGVSCTYSETANKLSDIRYLAGEDWDRLTFKTSVNTAARAAFDEPARLGKAAFDNIQHAVDQPRNGRKRGQNYAERQRNRADGKPDGNRAVQRAHAEQRSAYANQQQPD